LLARCSPWTGEDFDCAAPACKFNQLCTDLQYLLVAKFISNIGAYCFIFSNAALTSWMQ
jgi:hypothetical protein